MTASGLFDMYLYSAANEPRDHADREGDRGARVLHEVHEDRILLGPLAVVGDRAEHVVGDGAAEI